MTTFSANALEGRVALVTGTSRGIGAAILEAFVKAGATVVGTATSEAGAERITARIAELDGTGRGIVLNVCDGEASAKAVADTVAEFGRIDVLVNNAGITRDTLVMRMKDDAWNDVVETDLTAAFRLARACVRPMMKQRSGRIISITSVVGAMGNAGQVNYAAAKAGLMGMTKALAREIGSRGITVNCVAPGLIDTGMVDMNEIAREHAMTMIPMQRIGTPEEVAAVVGFLMDERASYITRQVINVNGGMI